MFELWKGLHDTPVSARPRYRRCRLSGPKERCYLVCCLALEITDRVSNDFAGQIANEEESSESASERLERSVHDLCRQGTR